MANFDEAIRQIQLATQEMKEDNDKAKEKYKRQLERKAWQDGLDQEYAAQIKLESMMGD